MLRFPRAPRIIALLLALASLCTSRLLSVAQAAELPRLGSRRPEVFSGSFSGMVVPLFLPRETVQSWLPAGLQLADCPYKRQPVFVMCGSIDDLTREKLVTVKPRFGRHFQETFIVVPYLRLEHASPAPPISHFVRLYSGSARSTTAGIKREGWPKIYVSIQTTDDTYRIFRDGTTPLLAADMDQSQLKPLTADCAALQAIREMLSQPTVLQRDGQFHHHAFDFHFESAALASIPVDLELGAGFMPGIKPTKARHPGIADADFGAFHIQCRYTNTVTD